MDPRDQTEAQEQAQAQVQEQARAWLATAVDEARAGLAEGGIPRYMAIFQETLPAEVGPVRSARSYYISWAAEWRSMYVHSGGSPQALATLRSKGNGQLVYNADEFRHATSFHRVTGRFAPHNLYTVAKKLATLAKTVKAKDGPLAPAWTFAPDAPLTVEVSCQVPGAPEAADGDCRPAVSFSGRLSGPATG